MKLFSLFTDLMKKLILVENILFLNSTALKNIATQNILYLNSFN